MKQYKSLSISLVVLLLGAISCSESTDPTIETSGENTEMEFLCNYPGTSRATETSFENGDAVGVFVTETSRPLEIAGNVVNNERFQLNGVSWTAVKPIYWNTGKFNVFAYYPYLNNINTITDLEFEVKTDQSINLPSGMSAYEASDFLYAQSKDVEATTNPVPLQFKHILSKLTIRLLKGENYEGEIPSSARIQILNTIPSATLDLEYGIATKNQHGEKKTIIARQSTPTSYSAILIPQRLDNRVPLIEVIMNGVSYLFESKFHFKAGTHHIVNLVIDSNPEQIKIEIGGEISNDSGWN